MKVRDLTPEERKELQDEAWRWFVEDAAGDIYYVLDTVAYLIEDKSDQWWVEWMSEDPETVREHLSFDPYADVP